MYIVGFDTGVTSQCYQQWVSKGSISLRITIIVSLISIWDKILFKPRVSFDGLVIKKKDFSESIHRIETHLDVIAEVLEVKISAAFELYLDEEFI